MRSVLLLAGFVLLALGIFFARDRFTLAGDGDFTGTFHLFKETVNGRQRTGRVLQGDFSSPQLGVNAYRFGDFRGSLIWVPERFEVTKASASVYGGTSNFTFNQQLFNGQRVLVNQYVNDRQPGFMLDPTRGVTAVQVINLEIEPGRNSVFCRSNGRRVSRSAYPYPF